MQTMDPSYNQPQLTRPPSGVNQDQGVYNTASPVQAYGGDYSTGRANVYGANLQTPPAYGTGAGTEGVYGTGKDAAPAGGQGFVSPFVSGPTRQKLEFRLDKLLAIDTILKMAEIVLGFIFAVCASVIFPCLASYGGYTMFVAWTGFAVSIFLFLYRIFDAEEIMPGPWRLIEMGYMAVFLVLLLAAFICCIVGSATFYWASIILACIFSAFLWLVSAASLALPFIQAFRNKDPGGAGQPAFRTSSAAAPGMNPGPGGSQAQMPEPGAGASTYPGQVY